MTTLTGPEKMHYAQAIIAVARTLEVLDKKMLYSDLAAVIDLPGSDYPRFRRLSSLLYFAAASERGSGKKSDFKRFINSTGKSGTGVFKTARIVISDDRGHLN
jgi:hypothetical protein